MPTYVYLMAHETLPVFKVGVADNVVARSKNIGVKINHAESFEIECASRKDAYRLEKLIHWAIEDHQCTDTSSLPRDGVTEWFAMSAMEKAIGCIQSPFSSCRTLRISKGIAKSAPGKSRCSRDNRKSDIEMANSGKELLRKIDLALAYIKIFESIGLIPQKNVLGQIKWLATKGTVISHKKSRDIIKAIQNTPKIEISDHRCSATVFGKQYEYLESEGAIIEASVGYLDLERMLSTAKKLGVFNELPESFLSLQLVSG